MYEYLLSAALPTSLVALTLTWLASSLASRPRAAIRSLAFNFTPAFAAAFFVTAPFSDTVISLPDVFACFFFEFVVLCLFCRLLISMLDDVPRLNDASAKRALSLTLVLQVLLAIPIITSNGFGIFSEGSRIEYLYAGASAKYLTYACILLAGFQAGLFANRLGRAGRPRGLDYLALAANFALSVLSGSKGVFFLWLLGSLALVDYRAARIRFGVAVCASLLITASFAFMVQTLAGLLGLTAWEFLKLALSRFFLSNDARALAFDLRPLAEPTASLFSESFRSLSALLGYSSSNPPLGVLFFDEYFGVSGGDGANASLTALIVYYSVPGYAALPALLATAAAVMLYLATRAARRALRGTVSRFAVTAWGIIALQQLSQDFLAFQVVMPLIVVAVVIMFVLDRGPFLASPPRRHRSTSLAQHRHSGART